jgi:hypothetical protein
MASGQVKIACYSLTSLISMGLLQVFQRSEGAVIALQNHLFALEKAKTAGAIAYAVRQREDFENLYLGTARSFCGIHLQSGAYCSGGGDIARTVSDGDFRPTLDRPQLEPSAWLCWDNRSFSNSR